MHTYVRNLFSLYYVREAKVDCSLVPRKGCPDSYRGLCKVKLYYFDYYLYSTVVLASHAVQHR